ncbi:MAG: hypothetical protein NXI24_22050 [bacterium]|nr:hypothetical protein [bacterium]
MFRAIQAGIKEVEYSLETHMSQTRPQSDRGHSRLSLRINQLKFQLGRYSLLRLVLFLGAVGVPLVLLYSGSVVISSRLAIFTGLPFALAFAFVYRTHHRLQRETRLAIGQRANYSDDALRGSDEWWERLPSRDEPPELSIEHEYADDLGLFGRFSIFQFLDRTATPVGRARMVDLLTSQPDQTALDPQAHAARTQAIALLSRRRVFRQRWRREGRPLAESYRKLFHLDWIQGIQNLPDAGIARPLVWLAFILPAITLGTYISFEMQWSRAYFLLTLPVQIVLFAYMHFRHRRVALTHAKIVDQLSGFEALFRVAAGLSLPRDAKQSEGEAASANLSHLKRLSVLEATPAAEIKRLSGLAGYFSFRRNPLLHGLAGIFFLYEAHVVHALSGWQRRCRSQFAGWFADLAELDALLAFSAAVDTEKHLCVPENLDALDMMTRVGASAAAQSGPGESTEPSGEENRVYIRAEDLNHPLLSPKERVSNDVLIETQKKLWLITGSNMSGKSTFLRTIGSAMLFAMIGAPVPARRFQFRPLRLMTSMNQRDDLSRSLSLFYAEVKRIEQLQSRQDQKDPPSLFLIDEMLRGTNARERLIASSGILEHMRASPALALVATHDLDLIELTRKHADVICYHFQEQIDENAASGRSMSFDYRLKEGPVTSSNALKILELEGVRL